MCVGGEEGGRGRKKREWVDERERVRTQRQRSHTALHHHATHSLLTPIPSSAASDATMQRREGRMGGRERRRESVEEAVCVWEGRKVKEGGRSVSGCSASLEHFWREQLCAENQVQFSARLRVSACST